MSGTDKNHEQKKKHQAYFYCYSAEKFIDMAREVEADEDEHAFYKKLKRLAKAKPKKEAAEK